MRSREAGLPFATRARKRELCLQRYLSRMTRKFLSPTFFKYFLKTTFLYVPCYPDHYEPKIFFRLSSKYFFRTENFQVKNFKLFWKLVQFMFQATLIIMSRKYFLVFKVRTRGFPLKFPSMSANNPKNTSVIS